MEKFCIIYSEYLAEGSFFVVDFETMQKKTILESEACVFKRLDQDEEKRALSIYEQKGDDNWCVIQGGDGRFYIAEIKSKMAS